MLKAWIVVGMAFGDESKGRVCDALVRRHGASLVVRFSGAHQCAHNVIAGGIHHCHSQFGSGTLAGARTHLGPRMLIEPDALYREAEVLVPKINRRPFDLLTIDPECVVIQPEHRMRNQALELARGGHRHGSCGLGVGEARRDELAGKAVRAKDLPYLWPMLRETGDALSRHENVLMEGNQGVLLDENYGFTPPHVTWTDCTFRNADELLDQVGCEWRQKIGVFRSYFTRHGAGPFPTEDQSLMVPKEVHNRSDHPWMGRFRTGRFDMTLARYAIKVARPNLLAVTHMDWRPAEQVLERIVQDLDVPVGYLSYGPAAEDQMDVLRDSESTKSTVSAACAQVL